MNTSLISDIEILLTSKREGQYWDFKEMYHENNSELLHDILCLANALHKGNRFLVYGVSDPKSGCQIKGVSNDVNRRSQTDLIDFLRSKPFAGDIRPEIELKTIEIENCEIDVLVIFDRPQKPYYLRNNYRDKEKQVRANSIYTKNLDTNTPIDSSADIWFVELMWRERFGLDSEPAERMVNLLRKPGEWDKDIGNKKCAYNKFNPEFQIEFGGTREFTEIFSYFYPNEKSYIGGAKFMYQTTTLFTLPYMFCDEMRIDLAIPENGCVRIAGRSIWYMYYIMDSRNGAFLNFLTNGNFNFRSRGSDGAFLLYKNLDERMEFEDYIANNTEKLDELAEPSIGSIIKERLESSGVHYVFDPVEMFKVQHLFRWWKSQGFSK